MGFEPGEQYYFLSAKRGLLVTQNYDYRLGDIVESTQVVDIPTTYANENVAMRDNAGYMAELIGSIKDLNPDIRRHFTLERSGYEWTNGRDTILRVDTICDGIDVTIQRRGIGMGSWYALPDVSKFGWVSFQYDFTAWSPMQFLNFEYSRIFAPSGKVTAVRIFMFDDCVGTFVILRPGAGSVTEVGPTVNRAPVVTPYGAPPVPTPRGF